MEVVCIILHFKLMDKNNQNQKEEESGYFTIVKVSLTCACWSLMFEGENRSCNIIYEISSFQVSTNSCLLLVYLLKREKTKLERKSKACLIIYYFCPLFSEAHGRIDRLSFVFLVVKFMMWFSSCKISNTSWLDIEQAQDNLMNLPLANGWGEKHRLFVKWKYVEAKVLVWTSFSLSHIIRILWIRFRFLSSIFT